MKTLETAENRIVYFLTQRKLVRPTANMDLAPVKVFASTVILLASVFTSKQRTSVVMEIDVA